MAVLLEFKPRLQDDADRAEMASGFNFKLLFFTGVQYERIADEQPKTLSSHNKDQRKLPRRPNQRLKA